MFVGSLIRFSMDAIQLLKEGSQVGLRQDYYRGLWPNNVCKYQWRTVASKFKMKSKAQEESLSGINLVSLIVLHLKTPSLALITLK